MKILSVTDHHDTPETDQSRFTALGNFTVEHLPEYIVHKGDFSSFSSISHFDKDKLLIRENKRLKDELASRKRAIDLMWEPVRKLQEKQRAAHQRLYTPKVIWLYGNHDYWWENYTLTHPELEGMINLPELDAPPVACSYLPVQYKEEEGHSVAINGINFTHAIQGKNGPISSKYICERSFDVFSSSVVFGHSHILQFATRTNVDSEGKHVQYKSICGGCFFDATPEYAIGKTNDYSAGLLLLDSFSYGKFSHTWVDLEDLKGKYL